MNDIRRTILWVIFGFSMVLLWDQWQVHNGQKATFFPSPSSAAKRVDAVAQSDGVNQGASGAAANNTAIPTPSAQGAGAVPPLPATAAAASQPPTDVVKAAGANAGERFVVATNVLRVTFDTAGGSLVKAEMLAHADMENKTRSFVLFDDSTDRLYMAQTGLIGAGAQYPNHKTVMVASGARVLPDGTDALDIRFESPLLDGIRLVKTYTFKRSLYDIDVKHEIINNGTQVASPQLYLQLIRDGNKPPGESAFYSTFTGPAVYTDAKKYEKVEFSDIEKGRAEFEKKANDGYIAIVQHYFASAWLLANGIQRDFFMRKVNANLYAAGMITPAGDLAPGQSKTIEARLYAGPQIEKTLETLAPGFELVKDYGWLTILAKPLYWLLDKVQGYVGNWGWSIVALVVLLKAAFYWLNAQAYRSMAKMKGINPRVMEMRERLKDKPQEMQQEMMRIYKEEKVNPLGGCFPILIQIPVFIALYWVLLSSVEMRNAPWILWIKDLSSPDPYFLLPLLMAATTMFQTWLNPRPPDPMQAKLMWYMPLIFSVMFFFFPAGLVLYWLTNNILSIAQQWVINKQMGVLGK
ncbi:MAG: membrane protein insertase YidC [Burkholderiales bacterium]